MARIARRGTGGAYLLSAAWAIALPGLSARAADLEAMQKSTLRLLCKTADKAFTGSGFVVAAAPITYIVTNSHVATCAASADDQRLFIILSRAEVVPAQIVWSDPLTDLAVLRSGRPLDRPAARLADTAGVAAGLPVIVVGFPGAADTVVDSYDVAVPSVTRGYVSRVVSSAQTGVRYFQHSAATNPGNSGGPVYDEAGDVIGVNSLKALALVAGITRTGISAERVAEGEGIAAAIDAAELVAHLKSENIPYDMASPSTVMSMAINLAASAAALLLLGGGILVATPGGRNCLLRRAGVMASVSRRPGAPARGPARPGKIRIVEGSLSGLDLPASESVLLGRDPSQAQVVFPDTDTTISRLHCEIRFDSNAARFEIKDLGSRNGTFVASGAAAPRRLAPHAAEPIAPGQRVLIGSSKNCLVVELG